LHAKLQDGKFELDDAVGKLRLAGSRVEEEFFGKF
jgi:hypothetical protein